MKHWLLVEKQSLQIVNRYNSESPLQFGGHWSNLNAYMHLECPDELKDKANLAVVYENAVVDRIFTPCTCEQGKPVFRKAFDKQGNVLISPNGQPLYAQMFEQTEVYAMTYVVKEYSP